MIKILMRAGFLNTFLVLIIIELAFIHNGQSQNPTFSFNTLSTLNGLSNNSVTSILEDSRGFLWFATSDGLNRYNGYSFIQYKNEVDNSNSLTNSFILCLAEDTTNNIWIGTNQSGIVRYNLTEEKFYRYVHIPSDLNTIPGTVIRKIRVDKKNQVWVGTDNGLAKYNTTTDGFKRFRFPINNGLFKSEVDVRNIILISEDEMVVECNLGLFRVNLANDNIYKIEYASNAFSPQLLNSNYPILFDNANNLWIGSSDGLIKYNLRNNNYKQYRHKSNDERSVSSHNFSIIYQDSKNNIWVGTQDNGVNLYNPKSDDFTVLKADKYKGKGLSSNIVNYIYEDSHRNLWIATQDGGISYINSANSYFEHFSHNPVDSRSLSNNSANSFYEDLDGNVWVGTGDGVLNKLVNNKEFEKYSLKDQIISPSILGITQKESNRLLVTGWGIGLYEFNTRTHSFNNLMQGVSIDGSLPSKNIKGIGTDVNGYIWLASHNENGLLVYSTVDNKFYSERSPGPFNVDLMKVPYSVEMIQDQKKRIWIVSYSGLYMFDTKLHVFKNLPDNIETLGSDYVYTIFEDNNGQLWVGNSTGLDKIVESSKGITFERMNYHFPIPNNIKGILQDNQGYLWLSSNSELTQFHPQLKTIKHFKINKELPIQEFSEHACLHASNGEMYFGGTSGFFRFKPDSIINSKFDCKIYISDFLLFNKPQKVNAPNSPLKKTMIETEVIELEYDQSVISFEYGAINFNPYNTVEFAYKMEGFDKNWYFVGEKRSVTYTNLPHGKYKFIVRLAEGNELSETEGAEVVIIIHPPFWKTKWAYIIYFIVLITLLYLFRYAIITREKLKNELKFEKINIKNVREANLMKLRFFTNISHEFRTPLTLIKAPLEKLLDSDSDNQLSDDNKYHLGLIHKNTERLLKMVNQLMDYRKLEAGSLVLEPSHGDVVAFCKNTWSAFVFLAEQKNINYIFESKFESLMMSFDTDKLDKILSNLLSNAFKYTQKYGQISVTLSKTIGANGNPELLKIVVKDTGIGISSKDLPHIFERFYSVSHKNVGKIEGTGIGLTLAKELTELHRGKLQVESTLGEGAEFSVNIPLMSHTHNQTSDVDDGVTQNLNHERAINKIDTFIDREEICIKPTILLVEDDDELREFIKNELKADYQIVLAKNGEEGLRKAFFNVPDLVLSDIMMPKMDGFELCKTLKADERTSHLPVILLTARHSQQKQLEGFDVGADDYIFKPFSVALLKSRIHNLLYIRKEIIEKFKKGTSLYFETDQVDNKDTQFIQRIIDLVLENITDENINADYIAGKMLVSRSLVYLKIEALAGQTVNEFVRNIRLKKSLRLLEQNSLTVTEIAYAVGFSSQSYFTRSFTKQYGVSPKEYLSKHKS